MERKETSNKLNYLFKFSFQFTEFFNISDDDCYVFLIPERVFDLNERRDHSCKYCSRSTC